MLNIGRKPAQTTVDDLRVQVSALMAEVARQSRELEALKRAARIPTAVAHERTGCALIADRLGLNERTVRKTLVDSPAFAQVRDASAARGTTITRNAPFLAWLSENLDKWPA